MCVCVYVHVCVRVHMCMRVCALECVIVYEPSRKEVHHISHSPRKWGQSTTPTRCKIKESNTMHAIRPIAVHA